MDRTAADTATLMTWLSPAFPVGGFAWSGGLEAAVASGLVTDRDGLMEWLTASLQRGTARLDLMAVAIVLSGKTSTKGVDEHLLAMATTPERESELREMGQAFWAATHPWRDGEAEAPATYPAAFALMAQQLEAASIRCFILPRHPQPRLVRRLRAKAHQRLRCGNENRVWVP